MIGMAMEYLGVENLEELALTFHMPQEATYVFVWAHNNWKVLNKRRVEFNSRYRLMDYYSRIVSTNKPVASKAIQSNNYCSFFAKGNITEENIDDYFEETGLPADKQWYKEWVKSHLTILRNEYKGFVKIFFPESPETYRELGMQNWEEKSITMTPYDDEQGAPICYNVNLKKGYTRNRFNTYLVDRARGLQIKIFYDLLTGLLRRGKNMIYVYENGFYAGNEHDIPNFFIKGGVFLKYSFSSRGTLAIEDMEPICGYNGFLCDTIRMSPPKRYNLLSPEAHVGEMIMQERKKAGYSRPQMCQMADIPLRTLESWEYENRRISLEGLQKILNVLNMTLDEFFAKNHIIMPKEE